MAKKLEHFEIHERTRLDFSKATLGDGIRRTQKKSVANLMGQLA